MKKICVIAFTVVIYLILSSCQQIFTYSVLEWAQRDPSNLPPAQQIAYAESALASGDEQAIIDAYNAIKDLDTAEADLLASELAFAGSGVSGVIAEATTMLLEGTGDPTSLIDTLSGTLLQGAADELESAINNGAVPSEEQYLQAAAALLLIAIQSTDRDSAWTLFDGASLPADLASATSDAEKALFFISKAEYTDWTDLSGSFSF
ncbi:MAG: hypothetical protein PF693_17480 [Spirochaetia bacterium]|nr:hypothetical protein [Spirochaetia bacterium]